MFRKQRHTTAGIRFALSLLAIAVLSIAALANAAPAATLRNGLDPTFVADAHTGPDSFIEEVVLQPDGKILVAGVSGTVINRLNSDGSDDAGFDTSYKGFNWVTDVDLLPSGKMYIATAEGLPVFGSRRPSVRRLNADGTVDTSFTLPSLDMEDEDNSVSIEALPDGRLYVKTNFLNAPVGSPSEFRNPGWRRLLSDGSFDTSFTVNGKYVDQVRLVDAQGRTYFSNLVTSDGTREAIPLARLLPNDTIDPSFNPTALNAPEYANGFGVFPQANGGLLITNYIDIPNTNNTTFTIVRLLSDGSLDPNFNFAPIVLSRFGRYLITPLANGRFLLGSQQRFLANGTADPTFEPFPIFRRGGKGGVGSIAEQPDGKLILGGRFEDVGIPPRNGVVRLLADNSPPYTGPVACVVKRYTGDGTGSWGDTSRTFYEAGTTFTLQARSNSSVRAIVFTETNAVTTLSSIGSRYTAPRLTEYDVGFSSATTNTGAEWVEVKLCGPASVTPTPTPSPTPTPTCVVKRYVGDGTGSWGTYGQATYSQGTTFTLVQRSSSAVRGMVFVDANAIRYLANVGDSYSAPQRAAYNVGFTSTTANTSSRWVEIKICTPGGAATNAVEEPRGDELAEPTATMDNSTFLPLMQESRE